MAHHPYPAIDRDDSEDAIGGRIIPAGIALLLGAVLVLSLGFAPIEAIHNAAHDSRHSLAFPCH
jgi:cobalt transporter subunit CbtB